MVAHHLETYRPALSRYSTDYLKFIDIYTPHDGSYLEKSNAGNFCLEYALVNGISKR